MATEKDVTESVIDSAIGPLKVRRATMTGFDVDDFVSTTVDSQATHLRMLNAMDKTNPLFAKNRPPVRLGDKEVGGY